MHFVNKSSSVEGYEVLASSDGPLYEGLYTIKVVLADTMDSAICQQ